jgi:hypothetical protein
VKPVNINIKFNIDIPERNNMKNIEKSEPKVSLVVINHNNIKLEYYVVIDCIGNGDIFAYCNWYTNVMFLEKEK